MNDRLHGLLHGDSAPTSPAQCPTELDARVPLQANHIKAILVALDGLPPGQPQFVRTRSHPSQLLHALAARNVSIDSIELPDGSWRTALRRTESLPSL